MRIETWMKARRNPVTLPAIVRKTLERDPVLANAETTFRGMCVLEALLRNGWSQQRAADYLGVNRLTVTRTVRALGISGNEFRAISKVLGKAAQ